MSSKMESIRKRFSMDLKDYIESIPGFPKEGIVFRESLESFQEKP